jgi:hypothetical protein
MKDLYPVDSEYSRILEDIMMYAEENEGVISKELEKTLEFAEINIEETGKCIKNIDAEVENLQFDEREYLQWVTLSNGQKVKFNPTYKFIKKF